MTGGGLTLGHLWGYLRLLREGMFLSLFAVTRERLFIDMSDKGKTEVYFDGACPLCRREISLYRKLDKEGVVSWVDVANSNPTVSGLTKDELLKRFHIKNKEGVMLSGARAFFDLWKELPGWKWLGRLGKYSFVVNMAEILYIGFLRVRPLMQRCINLFEKNKT